jgi:hypothetical protein
MSHLVDRNKVKVVELGPCDCPGKPHETDTVRIRESLSYADHLHLVDANNLGVQEALWALFNMRVAGWNLVDEKGKPLLLSRGNWQNLSSEIASKIQDAISEVQDSDETAELPNE